MVCDELIVAIVLCAESIPSILNSLCCVTMINIEHRMNELRNCVSGTHTNRQWITKPLRRFRCELSLLLFMNYDYRGCDVLSAEGSIFSFVCIVNTQTLSTVGRIWDVATVNVISRARQSKPKHVDTEWLVATSVEFRPPTWDVWSKNHLSFALSFASFECVRHRTNLWPCFCCHAYAE